MDSFNELKNLELKEKGSSCIGTFWPQEGDYLFD
jgi:hypothetical protein